MGRWEGDPSHVAKQKIQIVLLFTARYVIEYIETNSMGVDLI